MQSWPDFPPKCHRKCWNPLLLWLASDTYRLWKLYNCTNFHMNQNQMQCPEKSLKDWNDLVCESWASLGVGLRCCSPSLLPRSTEELALFHALWIKSWPQWPYWEPCYWVRCSQDLTLCDCMPSKIGDTLKTLSSLLPRIPCKDFVLLYSQHIFPICIFVWLLRFPNLKVLHHFVSVSVSSVHVCVFSESILSVSAKDFVNKCENYKQDKKYFRK